MSKDDFFELDENGALKVDAGKLFKNSGFQRQLKAAEEVEITRDFLNKFKSRKWKSEHEGSN